jgi:hypothetical protein
MPTPLPSGRRPYLPAGLYYDGRTRDFLLDSNGQHRGVHPNDEGMALSFAMRKGECPAAPDVGNELYKIPYITADDIDAQIETQVRNAYPCSRLIAEGKVRIDSIKHEARPETNGLAVVVNYTNLDTSQRESASWYS